MHRETGGNGGVIVNISSVVGLDPVFLLPVYSASKEAIVAFTRAFSVSKCFFFMRFKSKLYIYILFAHSTITTPNERAFALCAFARAAP